MLPDCQKGSKMIDRLLFALGGAVLGGFVVGSTYGFKPSPPLIAYGCKVLDMTAGVTLDGDLACFGGDLILNHDLLDKIIEKLRNAEGDTP